WTRGRGDSNRHGEKSDVPPHKVNYLGNIQAFASSHVECILSIGTVGSMKKSIQPRDFVIPHDFVDFTKSRQTDIFLMIKEFMLI
ncbi:purine nucleoside phosphorylase, partial [Thermoplasmatales archaeon SCGC AB-540-F20]